MDKQKFIIEDQKGVIAVFEELLTKVFQNWWKMLTLKFKHLFESQAG